MDDGVFDFRPIGAMIDQAGYRGLIEVEVFLAADWWKKSGDEVLRTVIVRFNTVA